MTEVRSMRDVTKGRLRVPLRSAVSALAGEFWLDGALAYLRGNDVSTTLLRLLTSADLGQPNGVAPLGADGKLASSYLPDNVVTTDGGGGSGAGGASGIVGEIKMWGGDPFALPSGWLVCDGSEVTKTAYATLFGVFGHRWGVPSDYSTKFRLPDFVGRSPVGAAGANDASAGAVRKITVRNPGTGFTNGTYALTLNAGAGVTFSTAPTISLTVAGGKVARVDVVTGGAVSGVTAAPTLSGAGQSNCGIIIPSFAGVGYQFEYDVTVVPTSSAALGWAIKMTDRGAGYTSAPAVTITGGDGTETAVAILDGSTVREIIVTNAGNGTPTGVSFSGGGFTTTAAATIVAVDAPVAVGDRVGDTRHVQLEAELALHRHGLAGYGITDAAGNKNAQIDSDAQPESAGNRTGPKGSSAPLPMRPLGAGVLYIVYAGA